MVLLGAQVQGVQHSQCMARQGDTAFTPRHNRTVICARAAPPAPRRSAPPSRVHVPSAARTWRWRRTWRSWRARTRSCATRWRARYGNLVFCGDGDAEYNRATGGRRRLAPRRGMTSLVATPPPPPPPPPRAKLVDGVHVPGNNENARVNSGRAHGTGLMVSNVCMCMCMCMCVCVCVCMYVCVYVCVFASEWFVLVCFYACVRSTYVCACLFMCMSFCLRVCGRACVYIHISRLVSEPRFDTHAILTVGLL